jgi:glycosyltransferase involved in cell wall biosynthesis
MVILADFGYLELETHSLKMYLTTKFLYLVNFISLLKVTHAVTISEFTRKQTIRLFGQILPRERVTTVWAGYRDLSTVVASEPRFQLPETFYLCIGVIKERKNQLKVVEAFLSAKEKGLQGSLVIAGKGKGEYYEKIVNTIRNSPNGDSVIMAGYVTDNEVVYLYKKARALVFPSKLEGFGFPVLEAMSLGTPVITSNSTSLVEVAGDAALLVDPESEQQITEALLLMENATTREEYIKKGYVRIQNFSWEKTAKDTLDIIESI